MKNDGAARRDEGIERADRAADRQWKVDCDLAIYALARKQPDLTTDDVWARLERLSQFQTREGRAMGARMRAAEKSGWIEATDTFRATDRPSRHRAPVRVWRSRLCSRQPA